MRIRSHTTMSLKDDRLVCYSASSIYLPNSPFIFPTVSNALSIFSMFCVPSFFYSLGDRDASFSLDTGIAASSISVSSISELSSSFTPVF